MQIPDAETHILGPVAKQLTYALTTGTVQVLVFS